MSQGKQNKRRVSYILISIIGIILVMVFVFHRKDPNYNDLLSMESIVEEFPDSVWADLQKINKMNLSDKAEALYYLLLTQSSKDAEIQSYNDSLINISLDYYLMHNDSARIFKSYYLRGALFHRAQNLIEATDSYLHAKEYENSQANLYTKYLLNKYMGEIYHFKTMWNDEKQVILKAYNYALALNDSAVISQALQGLAEWYYSQRDYKTSNEYLKRALGVLPDDRPDIQADLYEDIAMNYQKRLMPDSVLHYMNLAGKTEQRKTQIYKNQFIRATAYSLLHENDSIKYFLENSIDSLDIEYRVQVYYDLYHLKKQFQQDDEAYKYLQLHVHYRDSLDNNQEQLFLERLKGIESYQQQRNKARQSELKLARAKIWFYRIVTSTMLLSIILSYKQYKSQKKKKQLERKIQIEKQKATEALLEQQNIEYLLLQEKENREKLEIDKLELTVEYYKRLNAITVPILLKSQNKQGAMKLGDDEWEIIIKNTNACFDKFTERLKKTFPMLDEEEIRFCCLVKMELSMSLLAEIYHIAKGSISRKKMRMKEKMNICGISFDDFIKSF